MLSREQWAAIDKAYAKGVTRKVIYEAMVANGDMPFSTLGSFMSSHSHRLQRQRERERKP